MKNREVIIYACAIITIVSFSGCKDKTTSIVSEWQGREIMFPDNSVFTIQGKDTVDFNFKDADYKIVSYIDSIGCISCQLRLADWKKIIEEVDSIANIRVPFVFYFSPKRVKQIAETTRRESFFNPICIDMAGDFNSLNKFPGDVSLRTFLIDKGNKVLAVGNPMLNPKIKDLYIQILTGKEDGSVNIVQTKVEIESKNIDLGEFSADVSKTEVIKIKNTGDSPLIMQDVVTSCGCTKVNYSNKPVLPGEYLDLSVTYKPDGKGYIRKNDYPHLAVKNCSNICLFRR